MNLYQYFFKVLAGYFLVLGLLMLTRGQIFMSQLQALSIHPELVFSLGFIVLILGLMILASYPHLGRAGAILGLLVLFKAILCLAFPDWAMKFAQMAANIQVLHGIGLVLLGLAGYLLYLIYIDDVFGN